MAAFSTMAIVAVAATAAATVVSTVAAIQQGQAAADAAKYQAAVQENQAAAEANAMQWNAYNAAVAEQQRTEQQAQILEQQAASDRATAGLEEADFRRAQSREMARRRALLGAAGVDAGEGSPLLASQDFTGEVELQALRIRSGGELNAYRGEQQASLVRTTGRTSAFLEQDVANRNAALRLESGRTSATLSRLAGDNALTSSYFRAGSSLLSGIGSTYSVGRLAKLDDTTRGRA